MTEKTEQFPYLGRIRQAWVATDDADERLAELDMDPDRFREIIQGTLRPNTLDMALMATAFRTSVEWLADVKREHKPIAVYDRSDPDRISPPAEVCYACSDLDAGKLVPAPFCKEAKARMEAEPGRIW
jgi:hypothetical protein